MGKLDDSVFSQAVNRSRVGIAIADAHADDVPLVYVNDAFCALTGYDRSEMIGRNCRFLQGTDRQQPAVAALRQAIADGRPCTVTVRNYRKDRSFFWNEVSIAPLDGDGDTPRWFLGTLRDVTNHFATREKLTRIREELQTANVRLQDLAQTDALTGISNRRYFDRMLKREWRIAKRSGAPLSLLMLDVDNFKNYNDTFGHQAGDEALRRVAHTIDGCLRRAGEFAARYGGEEFIALMNASDENEAYEMGLKICDAVRDLAIENPNAPSPLMTISGGTATARRDNGPQDSSKLVKAADKALYEAKLSGKDRIVSAMHTDTGSLQVPEDLYPDPES